MKYQSIKNWLVSSCNVDARLFDFDDERIANGNIEYTKWPKKKIQDIHCPFNEYQYVVRYNEDWKGITLYAPSESFVSQYIVELNLLLESIGEEPLSRDFSEANFLDNNHSLNYLSIENNGRDIVITLVDKID